MGIDYCVLDKKNQRIFDLGRWPFECEETDSGTVLSFGPERRPTRGEFRDALIASWRVWTPPPRDGEQALAAVADKLFRFCEEADWDAELVSDARELPDWPRICSRHTDDRLHNVFDPDPLGGVGWSWTRNPAHDQPPTSELSPPKGPP